VHVWGDLSDYFFQSFVQRPIRAYCPFLCIHIHPPSWWIIVVGDVRIDYWPSTFLLTFGHSLHWVFRGSIVWMFACFWVAFWSVFWRFLCKATSIFLFHFLLGELREFLCIWSHWACMLFEILLYSYLYSAFYNFVARGFSFNLNFYINLVCPLSSCWLLMLSKNLHPFMLPHRLCSLCFFFSFFLTKGVIVGVIKSKIQLCFS